jgi:hypothetical protein
MRICGSGLLLCELDIMMRLISCQITDAELEILVGKSKRYGVILFIK